METFFALLALWAGNSPVTGEYPSQRPVTQSFDVSFDLRLNQRLSKQSWGWWFETPSRSSWRHCDYKMCPVSGKLCRLHTFGHTCSVLGPPCVVGLHNRNGFTYCHKTNSNRSSCLCKIHIHVHPSDMCTKCIMIYHVQLYGLCIGKH